MRKRMRSAESRGLPRERSIGFIAAVSFSYPNRNVLKALRCEKSSEAAKTARKIP
ncbi:hypothetical protein [Lysobacter sp. CA196]|uniref:hypothetical protein n=1 Tax=Lysobacter sp. CA196 TaxID=3455606 RepID=UPI003F8D185A